MFYTPPLLSPFTLDPGDQVICLLDINCVSPTTLHTLKREKGYCNVTIVGQCSWRVELSHVLHVNHLVIELTLLSPPDHLTTSPNLVSTSRWKMVSTGMMISMLMRRKSSVAYTRSQQVNISLSLLSMECLSFMYVGQWSCFNGEQSSNVSWWPKWLI